MNLNNILWVYNTRKILPKAPVVENLFGINLIGEGIITTTTGNPVSIITNKAQNAISTILSYSPKQSGTGDPSPQNIRPIEGWTEANLGVNSENPTLTISLGGTYYGFSIDLERGKLVNNYYMFNSPTVRDVGIGTYTNYANIDVVRSSVNAMSMSSSFKRINVSDAGFNGTFRQYAQSITIYDDRFTSKEEANACLQGVQFLIVLRDPIELPLTPQIVALLALNNTLWTDGDSVTITYRR